MPEKTGLHNVSITKVNDEAVVQRQFQALKKKKEKSPPGTLKKA